MRASGAVLSLVAILALGFAALSYQGQAVEDPAVTNGTAESANAWNLTTGVFEVSGQTLSVALLLGGIGLVTIMGVGIMVAASPGGR